MNVLSTWRGSSRHRERGVKVALAIAAAVMLVPAIGASGTPGPRCFGAAARDPAHPCENAALRRSVVPRPRDALLEPSAACTPIQTASPEVCAFGVASERAAASFALVGDSHAVHWRAALEIVARAKHWRGLTLYRSRCPLSLAERSHASPDHAECERWKREVLRWFTAHPEIGTVVVSQRSSTGVVVAPGHDAFETQVAGYAAAWQALPASVEHIVVIREPPYNSFATNACVERAIRRHRRADLACARTRRIALRPDPAAVAATRLATPRVQLIDLSHFMCDRTRCFPVVGGALVHKDRGHLTRVFSATLGPYVLRALNHPMPGRR